MNGNLKRGTLIAALLAAAAAAGCAQDIGDIDRTEPNRVKKADLESGAWWMHQKIVDVPGSSSLEAFEGLMMDTEKVVFVAEENYLMAYRSYPILPGSDHQLLNMDGPNSYEELYGDNYKGNVLAMYPITSHFDVQRTYDTTTGEQSNVIEENTSDRPWYERDYMRVKWNENPIVNFEWVLWYDMDYEIASYQEAPEHDALKAPYFEYDENGQLVYFDAPSTYVVQTTLWDWFYDLIGWGYADGNAAIEIRVVTSFGKDLGDADSTNNYEPLDYENKDMNRFGFFRTERWTYDNHHGIMNAGRIELANRHNIWQASYDAAGNAIPIENRQVRTIPYYILDDVKEELLHNMAVQVIDEWNYAFKRAVYIMQHPDNTVVNGVDLVTTIDYETLKAALPRNVLEDIYVPCHIPVEPGERAECGEPGYVPREGDFRKNFLWLVNQRQDVGLLGYCPSVTDPLTGRTISAQAHVYTAPMNEIASSIVDQIKWAKGELTIDGVRTNDAAIARARESREKYIEYSKLSDRVRTAQLNSAKSRSLKAQKRAEHTLAKKNLRKFDYVAADNKLAKLVDSGLLPSDLNQGALKSVMKSSGVSNPSLLSDNARNAASLYNILSFQNRSLINEMQKKMGAKGYCFKDPNAASYDIMYSYLKNKYATRSDYDNIFNEVRAQVFRATALHEMGHGFGLRHNHTGSFDSMNYFDEYWRLRGKDDPSKDQNFWKDKIESVGDMYKLYDYTDEQLNGGMLVNMYSSIMDYSSGYVTDNMGLGKYDHAAILYGYSGGTSYPTAAGVDANGQRSATVRKGLVEIFTKSAGVPTPASRDDLGRFAYDVLKHKDTTAITSTFDDQTTVGQPYFELVHFRDFFASMKGFDFIKNRKVVRLEEFQKHSTDADLANKTAWVRVPYLFCTDDNRGSLRSCNVFDHGADYYEQVSDIFRNYTVNYWFKNFARGRAFWDSYSAAAGYNRYFMMLSDYMQNDYVSDWETLRDVSSANGYTLNDDVNEMASGATFNFMANIIATPEYGIYCKRKDNGALFNLSNDDEANASISEFNERARCGRDPEYYYVRQGEGRRRYQKYDVEAGFDYSLYELELEHNYTSLFAILALFDNEANVIVDSGDMGTYTLGMYTRYREEAIKLTNGVLAEEYSIHSPILYTDDGQGGEQHETYLNQYMKSGNLKYPALVKTTYYNADGSRVEYDPLTGESTSEFAKLAASKPQFAKCSSADECLFGNADDTYCGTLYEGQKSDICFGIFFDGDTAEANCPSGTRAVDLGGEWVCELASNGDPDTVYANLANTKCSPSYVAGACDNGNVCRDGVCQEPYHRVESDSSLTQKYYMTIYGTLLTGPIEMDTTLYDQLNIYRKGSGDTNVAMGDFQEVTFENPITGEIYAANDRIQSSNVSDVTAPGGAMLVKKGQRLADTLEELWPLVLEWNDKIPDGDDYEQSEEYQKFMDYYYAWYRAKYDLESVVQDINLIRAVYDYFGSVW